MAAFPTGTVTIVFTDIQGSTKLWERLGDRFAPVLEQHNTILRDNIRRHEGHEVKTEGDAFMAVFGNAANAVRFAAATQKALHAATWPSEVTALVEAAPSADGLLRGLRVRIGMHTGEPICEPESASGRMDYFGPMVNRAARVASSAQGGQVLVSESTLKAAGTLDGIAAKDLGEHRLKGIEKLERLFQVMPVELASRVFEPLKTLSAVPTNLPAQTASFIGREKELAQLSALLADPAVRHVTLTAPGGTGKSRLSLRAGAELLDRFEGGVWFVSLADCRNAEQIANATARSLGVMLSGKEEPCEAVARVLEARKPLLLILDNFEQVVSDAAATAGLWLQRAANVKLLVTSQTLLGLSGEREFQLGPLAAPDRIAPGRPKTARVTAKITAFDGVKLFLERAREADPKFMIDNDNAQDIANICAEVEGIPLAIELAAARVRVMKPAQIAQRLGKRFELLKSSRRDVASRHQTLLGAVEWSYELLKDWEKSALAQLSIFTGGFFLEAAEAVLDLSAFPDAPLGMDAVQSLREKSLLKAYEVEIAGRAETRFGMYLTIREFAQSKLAALLQPGAVQGLHGRHATWARTYGEHWKTRVTSRDAAEALTRLELDVGNLSLAADWYIAHGRAEEGALAALAMAPVMHARALNDIRIPRLKSAYEALAAAGCATSTLPLVAGALGRAYTDAGKLDEARRFRDLLVKMAEDGAAVFAPLDVARIYNVAAMISSWFDRRPNSLALYQKAYDWTPDKSGREAMIFRVDIANAQVDVGNPADTLDTLDAAIAYLRDRQEVPSLAHALGTKSRALLHLNRRQEAIDCLVEAEQLDRMIGRRDGAARHTANRGQLMLRQGNAEEGLTLIDRAIAEVTEIGRMGDLLAYRGMRVAALNELGQNDKALEEAAELVELAQKVGDKHAEAMNRGRRGAFLTEMPGRLDEGLAAIEAAEHAFTQANEHLMARLWRATRTNELAKRSRFSEALPLAQSTVADLTKLGVAIPSPLLASLAESLLHAGDRTGALKAAHEALVDKAASVDSKRARERANAVIARVNAANGQA